VTLSPVPDFARWLDRERNTDNSLALSAEDRTALAGLDQPDWWQAEAARDALREPLMRAAAWYFLRAKSRRGMPVDSVARFHLGNGARLERINWLADLTEKGIAQSYGLMVNYLYDLDDIEKNHEAFAGSRAVVASNAVKRLQRQIELVVPVAG
jgi:malonyl-CoA decarboxylase